jgi:hypothetical protein
MNVCFSYRINCKKYLSKLANHIIVAGLGNVRPPSLPAGLPLFRRIYYLDIQSSPEHGGKRLLRNVGRTTSLTDYKASHPTGY